MESSIEQGVRLEKLIKGLNFKQLSFAKAVGVSQGFVTQMVNGKKNISYGFQKKLLEKFPDVNIQWLLTGEGEMFLSGTGEKRSVEQAAAREEGAGLGPLLEEMLRLVGEFERGQAELEARLAAVEARLGKDEK